MLNNEQPKDMYMAIEHIIWTIRKSPQAYLMFRNRLSDVKGEIEKAEQRELTRRIHND